jgi:transcriptional regulator with XRE-family HTH domain
MGSQRRAIIEASARGRALTTRVLDELRAARVDRDISGASLARTVGMSTAQYSRIERGLTHGITIGQASVLLAGVGLELSVRAFPAGEPIRDAGHAKLLGRFRARLHGSIRFQTEVPFPNPGDLRAWDVVLSGGGWRHGYEAETRPHDRQALERRLALKSRDGAVDGVSLLLLDSRHNRDFVRANADALSERFPVPGPRALELLGAGIDPGRGSVILL